jgi:hypothetical protein
MDAALVKIDTEGMEQIVWQGMSAMIAGDKLRCVIVEFTKLSYPDGGRRMIDEALAAGFSLNLIHDNKGVIPITADEIINGHYFQMLLLER